MSEPRIITADMIEFTDYPYAFCQSASDDSIAYTINYAERSCDCPGFTYSKRTPKTCKHVECVLRLMSIRGMPIPEHHPQSEPSL